MKISLQLYLMPLACACLFNACAENNARPAQPEDQTPSRQVAPQVIDPHAQQVDLSNSEKKEAQEKIHESE